MAKFFAGYFFFRDRLRKMWYNGCVISERCAAGLRATKEEGLWMNVGRFGRMRFLRGG